MGIKLFLKPQTGNDTSRSSKNVGSAKRLSGKVFVLAAFVGPPTNPWDVAGINRMKERLLDAERWLKTQALRYGKSVEFVNSFFGSDGSFTDSEIPQGHESPNAWGYPSTIVKKMGFASPRAFVDWVRANTGCDQCLGVIFPNVKGRSYAAPVNEELFRYDPRKYSLECCLVYRCYTNSTLESSAAVIAHEMLHLFGAWDLYELDDSDHGRYIKTGQMFPNSIMLCSSQDIWFSNIDEINAWLVGLKEEGKDWYRWFEPGQDSYQ